MIRMDVPVGTILDFAGANVPSGYLECDGSAVSRTAYPKLFAAIGTAWGAGNGSTTFNLPNLGGRTCIGKGSRAVGNTGGSETHTLTVQEMPTHDHTVNSSGYVKDGIPSSGSHKHGLRGYWEAYNTGSSGTRKQCMSKDYISGDPVVSDRTESAGGHTHNLPNHTHTMTTAGGGSSHSIMQPYAVVRKVIRAA